jgi:threonine dehydratase
MPVSLEDVQKARARIASVARFTPLLQPNSLHRLLGAQIFLKPELLQRTGSFKIRGAYNKIVQLTEIERARGVIAASAGNHAQGVAVAASLAGVRATVVMPETAAPSKVNASRAYGAEVILHGDHFRDAREHALKLQRARDLVLIHGFDDAAVIAGQGTVAIELLEALPDLDVVIVPVGGGGLIAGIATVLKTMRPGIRVVGVQAERAPAVIHSLAAGHPVVAELGPTLADGIAIERPGDIPFEIMRRLVDEVVTVTEDEIKRAIILLLQRTKLVTEGAGATPLAALLANKITVNPDLKVVLVLSGGNIDLAKLASVITSPPPSGA